LLKIGFNSFRVKVVLFSNFGFGFLLAFEKVDNEDKRKEERKGKAKS